MNFAELTSGIRNRKTSSKIGKSSFINKKDDIELVEQSEYLEPTSSNINNVIAMEGCHAASENEEIIKPAENRALDEDFRQFKRGAYVASHLPPEATVLKLVGPYGAPAMSMWHFESIILVGAGIGATPFAAMLRSANIKLKQRQVLESNMQQGTYSFDFCVRKSCSKLLKRKK